MKRLKFFSSFLFLMIFFNCTVVEYHEEDYYNMPLTEFLSSNEIWYVEINQTLGYGEIPFLQMAFTISFRNNVLYANNNLVGFGNNGDGFGVPVGNYIAGSNSIQISHVIDGLYDFEVYQTGPNQIELYDPFSETSYFLTGYQRYNFDYDYLFYDNVSYFLEEYHVWEKHSQNNDGYQPFDDENYINFSSSNNQFLSSLDYNVFDLNSIYWDYEGSFSISDYSSSMYLKNLQLFYYGYDETEQFVLEVLSDDTIRLKSVSTNKLYYFKGRGLISYMRPSKESKAPSEQPEVVGKKRYQLTDKKKNPRTI